MKKQFLFLPILCSFLSLQVHAQISGIINRYTAVSAIDSCAGRLTVGDTTGFRVGDLVLLIQMQGAAIMTGNNSSYGNVAALNSAGFHERAIIDSVGTNTVFVKNRFVHPYNPSGKVQLVSIPQFSNAVVSDTLRAKPWDGNTGGVLALDVSNTLTLNAPIIASGIGFRGGADYIATSNMCNILNPITGYVFGLGNWRGAYKGEGIAILTPGLELGRGPQANGGGGGNDHNAGGGGGGNISNGGDGGNNADPSPTGCNGYFPGLAGKAISANADRIFMGGGGGAGHANNLLKSKGGQGGGIVLVKAGAINGASPAIYAKGGDAGNSFDDGAGGGGAGGTIRLELSSPNPSLVLNANGGRGGSADNNNVDRCMGPGGGGAGGRILTNALPGLFSVAGGIPGITYNSTVGCNNSNNTSEPGTSGEIQPLSILPQGTIENFAPVVLSAPISVSVCPGENAIFSVTTNDGDWDFQWQLNAGAIWQDIIAGSNYVGFQSDSLIVQNPGLAHNGLMFRCRVIRAGCSATISGTATLNILPLPTVGFTITMNGATATFNNLSTNANSFFWTFGDGATSSLTNPAHTYTTEGNFIVTLSAWNQCDTMVSQQTVSVFLPPTAGFSVPATIIGCGTAQINFQNQSSANVVSFAWSFPGGTPSSSSLQNPSISYSVSGVYTARLIVTNTVGKDTLDKSFEVEIFDLPEADFSWQTLPGGLVQFTNLSQNGETYTWDFGDGSPQQNGFNIQHDYSTSGTYVVTLIVSSPCGVSLIQHDVVVQVVGTNEVQRLRTLNLFPNPASSWLMLDWSETGSQPIEIQMFDSSGRLVFLTKNPPGQTLKISLNELRVGLFQILVAFEGGTVSRAVVKAM
ncbi:MAG: PKD domain-containing protein [Saprospiraceae bacterium]